MRGIGLQMFSRKRNKQTEEVARQQIRMSGFPEPSPEKVAIKAQGRNMYLAIRRAEREEQVRKSDEAWNATKGLRANAARRK